MRAVSVPVLGYCARNERLGRDGATPEIRVGEIESGVEDGDPDTAPTARRRRGAGRLQSPGELRRIQEVVEVYWRDCTVLRPCDLYDGVFTVQRMVDQLGFDREDRGVGRGGCGAECGQLVGVRGHHGNSEFVEQNCAGHFGQFEIHCRRLELATSRYGRDAGEGP
ncbi:hypothetical protein Rwratislav_12898 [Rhodococcus wratislaviensis IFP 2016]|nr:hypothetical protein Rwratislav_12898 [Rhodococcus wratislaviensis IFP 2016]